MTCDRCGGSGKLVEKRRICHECEKRERRDWYYRDHKQNMERSRRYQASHKALLRIQHQQRVLEKRLLYEAAKSVACTDCGGIFPLQCMDFDHVRGEKRANVSAMTWTRFSVQSLIEEMGKCEVVCANCHRIRTQRRREGVARPDSAEVAA